MFVLDNTFEVLLLCGILALLVPLEKGFMISFGFNFMGFEGPLKSGKGNIDGRGSTLPIFCLGEGRSTM